MLGRAVLAAAERALNPVRGERRAARPEARALHAALELADLHADSLLWGRDLLLRGERGQADVPRLIEGRVAVQVFGLVTQVPVRIRASNSPDSDIIGALAYAGRWPAEARRSLLGRALYQAERLRRMAQDSGGRLTLIRSSTELAEHLGRWRKKPDCVGALLGVEGAQCLEGDLANLDKLFAAGVRMMAPSHFSDTAIGGSAHGMAKGGLTELGRLWLREMEARHMIVDLAHASPRTVDDVLALARRPVVVSHTGVCGTCDNARNLTDDQVRRVARGGGLVAVGYFPLAVCGADAAAVARAVKHAVSVAGPQSVALGSDFDGAVPVPFDASRLELLTEALLGAGLDAGDIRRVAGQNAMEFLLKNLPSPRWKTSPIR